MSVVIRHREWGIYLGNALGLGFWSNLDPVGQEYAVVFDKMEWAKEHLNNWDDVPNSNDIEYINVTPDAKGAISRHACKIQNIGFWTDELLENGEPK